MGGETLDDTTRAWLEKQVDGTLVEAKRHVARREAYQVRWSGRSDTVHSGFLRIDRHPNPEARVSLAREARICQALASTDIPAPAVLAWDPEQQLALFEYVRGRSDIDKLEDSAQQRHVMEHFIDAIARLHQLDPAQLKLDDTLGSPALTPAQCALDDLDGQISQVGNFLTHYRDPLLQYGVQWLRRFAPESVSRVSLVQGDTGPVNFMFDGLSVSAIVDWEWGHWGDPMEDLGNICVREFWNPSGGLDGLFTRYETQSGIPYDADAVRYYRVQQNVRGMIPIHAVCQARGMRESMAWYLTYREIGDRATCEAIAEAMGIPIEKPPLPDPAISHDPLTDAALQGLSRDVAPALSDEFARSRAEDIGILIEIQSRLRQYEQAFQAEEAEEIAALLQQPAVDFAQANAALCDAIDDGGLPDEHLVPYLARRAYRREWLHWPVTRLYPDRQWSPIDTDNTPAT